MRARPNKLHLAGWLSARDFYESVKPWRDKPKYGDERPFDKNRKRHYSVRITSSNGIAFKYHNTDVVVFYPDGTIELDTGGWYTQSTGAVMDAILPRGIWVSLCDAYRIIRLNDKVFEFPGSLTIDVAGFPETWADPIQFEPIEVLSIDRKMSRDVLKDAPWLTQLRKMTAVTRAMDGIPKWTKRYWKRVKYHGEPVTMSIDEAIESCKRGEFTKVLRKAGPNIVHHIRMRLYEQADLSVVKTEKRLFVNSRSEYDAIRARNAQLARL